jgi:hypothetical protein
MLIALPLSFLLIWITFAATWSFYTSNVQSFDKPASSYAKATSLSILMCSIRYPWTPSTLFSRSQCLSLRSTMGMIFLRISSRFLFLVKRVCISHSMFILFLAS